jgi:uncharacterized ion transporter superfamily protein YfcC
MVIKQLMIFFVSPFIPFVYVNIHSRQFKKNEDTKEVINQKRKSKDRIQLQKEIQHY